MVKPESNIIDDLFFGNTSKTNSYKNFDFDAIEFICKLS